MLPWPPALIVAWLIVARRRLSPVALGAFLLLAFAMLVQLTTVFDVIASRNQGPSGGPAGRGLARVVQRNLMLDPQWVSPLLVPMVLLWVMTGLRRRHLALTLASVAPVVMVAAPFFAVTQCSSDAVRYQGALLGLMTSLAVAGLWRLPFAAGRTSVRPDNGPVAQIATVGVTILQVALLATLVLVPPASRRPPTDPVAFEHRLGTRSAAWIRGHS
jgi:hypothetical protein